MRRIAIIIMTTLAVAACGSPTAGPGQPQGSSTTLATGTSMTTPESTTTSIIAQTTTTSAPPQTTTTLDTPTTTQPGTTSTTGPPATMIVAPYLYIDEAGHDGRTGPFLLPVARQVETTQAVGRAAMERLLAGPTKAETEGIPAITTMIPYGTRLLGLTIAEDVATVDLSAEFGATDDSAVVAQRAAQVVFTLSRFDSVAEVLFRQEGKAVSIQTGDGQLVDRPVGIWDYLDFAAALSVESPVYNGVGSNPLHVTGFGAVFEAAFQYALTDADGLIIEEGNAMTANGTGWGGFDFTIPYQVDRQQVGALIVWTGSAKDGRQIDIREYPVLLTP